MIYRQYLKFFINGGLLGVSALVLQWGIYRLLGGDSGITYGVATALTYGPLLLVNFLVQGAWIFKCRGLFWRFVLANVSIMILVSTLSPLMRLWIDLAFGSPWGDRGGFLLAALIGSVPSFLIQRHWVFGTRLQPGVSEGESASTI